MSRLSTASRRQRLIAFMRHLPPNIHARLNEARRRALSRAADPDFVWESLLRAMATLGGSQGHAGLIENGSNHHQVTYKALAALPRAARISRLRRVLAAANVRWPNKKAEWLATNHDIVHSMGGSRRATKLAKAQQGREAKIRFFTQFTGIGQKYARDIWMDTYATDFRDSIALDVRVARVSKLLGFPDSPYEVVEGLYQRIASDSGCKTWELDRVIYGFNDEVLTAMSA
jgi:endonuclease III